MKLKKNHELPFPREKVYAAWISSDTVIPPATAMDVYPVVGGHYRLLMDTPEFSTRNEGQFLVVEPPAHLRYSWEWNGDGEQSLIDVRFVPAGPRCQVRLMHWGFRNAHSLAQHDTGWDSYFAGLEAYLADI